MCRESMAAVAKSGKSAIVEVLSPGQRPTKRGLIYAATPASDFVCGTQQVASGITVQVLNHRDVDRVQPDAMLTIIKMATPLANAGLINGYDARGAATAKKPRERWRFVPLSLRRRQREENLLGSMGTA